MDTDLALISDPYASALGAYLINQSETSLYHASLLGQHFVERGLGPDDIVALHAEALDSVVAGLPYRRRAGAAVAGLQFLLDVMIAYGVHHQRYLELRLSERTRAAEAQATQARQRALDAERADREKSEILAAISHEIRTPLTAARGLMELAGRWLERGHPPERIGRSLASAHQALDRLVRLSHDLVEASRGEPPSLTLVPLDPGALVARACEWTAETAATKGVALGCACGALPPVRGDEDALLSVFGNLISNAIRYTPAGGRVDVSCAADDATVAVAVADTGMGMSAEVRDRIFEKFYRAPEAKATEAAGLGLGLAISLQIVRALSGELTVESAPGQGSTFRVMLPRYFDEDEEEERGRTATT